MNTDTYKARLLEEKAQLEKELQDLGRINPDNPEDWEPVPEDKEAESDRLHLGDKMEAYQENAAILADLETRWYHVKQALKRIEEGTYGTCTECGELIPEDRLDANPAALTCVAHATE